MNEFTLIIKKRQIFRVVLVAYLSYSAILGIEQAIAISYKERKKLFDEDRDA